MRRTLLFFTYFLLVTPIGLLWRLLRDPMQRRWDKKRVSYLTLTQPALGVRNVTGERP